MEQRENTFTAVAKTDKGESCIEDGKGQGKWSHSSLDMYHLPSPPLPQIDCVLFEPLALAMK